MAKAGYALFTAGQVLTAAQVNTYLMQQAVPQFATSAARDSALSAVLDEGLLSCQDDSNSLTVYSGAAWSTIGPVHGLGTTWTPTITQSGAVTCTVTKAVYYRLGRLIVANFLVAITGSGTGSNDIVIGGFPTAASGIQLAGWGEVVDTSSVTSDEGPAILVSTTTIKIKSSSRATGAYLGTSIMTSGLASGDFVSGNLIYEAAADA